MLGSLSTLGALLWLAGAVLLTTSSGKSSCPHVYAFDGEDFRIDGDMASGALYPGAQREDLDRLEHLRGDGKEYRLRVQNDLEEIDYVDRVALQIVDHAPGEVILPTQMGSLVSIRDERAPLRAVDDQGSDVLAAVMDGDGVALSGAMPEAPSSDEPRAAWTFDFPRPKTERAALVLHARNTLFAEASCATYMAKMGQGVGPLMAWVVDDECTCNIEMLDEEAEKLGLPLTMTILGGEAEARPIMVRPVGPAVMRAQAFVIDLRPGAGDTVSIRLDATPLFWEIDKVALSPLGEGEITPQVILPTEATRVSGDATSDVLGTLSETDKRRVALEIHDRVDLRFDEPPLAPGLTRTAIVALTGYYEMPLAGAPGINAATVIAHRTNLTSLPRFAADRARNQ